MDPYLPPTDNLDQVSERELKLRRIGLVAVVMMVSGVIIALVLPGLLMMNFFGQHDTADGVEVGTIAGEIAVALGTAASFLTLVLLGLALRFWVAAQLRKVGKS